MTTNLNLSARMSNLGTETAFEVLARAEQLAREGRDIINLGIGQPDFKTPKNIVAAGSQALFDGHHGYTPAAGIPALREAVASDIEARRGTTVSPDHILITPGGKPTMFFACLMFGEPGVEIMYPDPGFPIYESAIRFSGATPIPIRLHEEAEFSFNPDELLAQITNNTRLIILNSPANPTGGLINKYTLDTLVSGLTKFPDVYILSDEIYSRMVYEGQTYHSLVSYEEIKDRLILLDGWSKTYAMTGWRLGYSLWPKNLIEFAIKLCVNNHSCVNAATQIAGIEALLGPQDEVDGMMKAFDQRRHLIVNELNKIKGVKCTLPGGAFYAFANINDTGQASSELQNRLLEEAGVAAVSGTSFGQGGEGFIRFSYANSADNIKEAMSRFRKLVING